MTQNIVKESNIQVFSAEYERLMQKAKEVVPVLRERSVETQQLRRLPEKTIEDLKNAGFFKILLPKIYGGSELSIREYSDVIAEIARGCGSTSWVLTLIAGVNMWTCQLFDEEVHREIFGRNNDSRVCGVFEARKAKVRKVDGGYIIEDGLWGFCSGSWHADYFFLGIPLVNEQGEVVDSGVAILPKKEVNIKDDWYTVSMRGTGSNTLTVENVFVRDKWTISTSKVLNEGVIPSEEFRNIPSFKTTFLPALMVTAASPAVGLARAAMDYFMERLPNRRIMYTWYNKQGEATVTHLQVAEAQMKIDAAELLVNRTADDVGQWAEKGEHMDLHHRARAKADCGYAIRLAWEAVEIIMTASGGSSIADKNPFNTIMSDIRSPLVHGFMAPATNLETYGRILCGQEPNTGLI